MWRRTTTRGTATLAVELFRPVAGGVRDQIAKEAAAMLSFAEPAAAHDITFAPAA